MSKWFVCGVIHLAKQVFGELGGKYEEKKERNKKNKKKERKKEKRKEERRKGRELAYTSRDRFFSYLGYPCLGATQWPWSFALTWGLVQNSLG